MRITIESAAVKWLKEELTLKSGDSVRFVVRYGGNSTIQSGYSVGLALEQPEDVAAFIEKDGILFFVDSDDIWYFQEYDLGVGYNTTIDEIEFNYVK
ncbi:HesB/YadR/YfhF family protein [Bacillus sp. DX1.1]|uniref:HesB/YadR/YfhF family protein n=1 Tax=unclassified Bacillus (in: firmicutes) TaxID=185979 RepID=UPI0025711655|nr:MULTISPECIES: HesB/YadR/YfhF family protein [unclassified Bacillus (in: firmicutes)]MDM5154875.1 HesB/YadR/YfhF family protein [Bacillus sp. DX1.1]WJE83748.1 HesB/YadR/YfhF family protein [Bacillus sp. DX3.1]